MRLLVEVNSSTFLREKKERLNLNLLVKDVIDNITPLDRIKITIENELPDVLRDSVRMEQVFQNLIGNAIKFMDKERGRGSILEIQCFRKKRRKI